MRSVLAALLVAALVSAPAYPAVSGEVRAALSSPTNGRIVFARFRDANYSWDIHSIEPSGRNDTWLSEDRARYEVAPAVSPGGTRIAYEFDYDILVMNIDGSGRQQLTDDFDDGWERDISWSPDGQTLAFMSDRLGEFQLFTMSADGSTAPVRVSVGLTSVDFEYGWSPDGSELVFAAWDSGSQTQQLYRAAPDGTGLAPVPTGTPWPNEPSWSPDGARLAFLDDGDVWLADADGSDATDVTSDGTERSELAWSPSGDRILYLQGAADWKGLTVMDADGSNQTIVSWAAQSPRWSPDGTRIVFRGAMHSSLGEIYTIRASGGTPRRLTYNSVDDRDPDWGAGCSIHGTADGDTIEGTSGPDFICGGGGDDVVSGMAGDDVLLGGPGDDLLVGGGGGDVIAGEAGSDEIAGRAGDDTLNSMDGLRDELLWGGRGADRCRKDRRDVSASCEAVEQPI